MEKKKPLPDDAFIDSRLVAGMRVFSEATSIVIFFVAVFVLISWKFDLGVLTRVSSQFVSMERNSVIGTMLLGVSLWLLQEGRSRKWVWTLGRVCAVFVFILGIAIFVEYVLGLNLSIDQVFFRNAFRVTSVPRHDRSVLSASLVFIFLSLALLFLEVKPKRSVSVSQVFSILAGVISVGAVIGYIHNISSFYVSLSFDADTSLQAAIFFSILNFGVLLARPASGLVRVLVSSSFAGKVARRLLPTTLIAPLIISLLVEYGKSRNFYASNFSVGLETAIDIIILSLVVLISVILLEKEEIEKMNERLISESIVESLPGTFAMISQKGRTVRWNKNLETLSGYTKDELASMTNEQGLKMFYTKENAIKVAEAMEKTFREGSATLEVDHLLNRGRSSFTYFFNAVRVEINKELYIVVSGVDISKLKQAEASLLKEKEAAQRLAVDLEKFKLAVDNEADHVMITDAESNILYVNKAAENITGYKREEVIGKNAGKIWGGHMPNDFYDKMWHIIKTEKKVFFGEVINHRKNGLAYAADIRIAPIFDSNGQLQFFVGVERDISKEKEAEQIKTDFISFVSHQLRTPLTVMNWNTEMLRNGDAGELTREQKRYLTEIERGEKRMARLINSLLNISRFEANEIKIEPKPTDVLALISDAISEIVPYAGAKNCTINLNKPDQTPPLIDLDPILLKQIIINLLTNAARYSKTKKCSIEVAFKEDNEYYQIDVIDEGIGIPLNVQNKIFDKFFRAENAVKVDTEGTGLGLYITKLIVEVSGGKIWFESTEGEGTAFHFTIPKSGMKKMAGEKEMSV